MFTFDATEQINEVSRTRTTRTTTRTTTQVITRYFGRWPQTKILNSFTFWLMSHLLLFQYGFDNKMCTPGCPVNCPSGYFQCPDNISYNGCWYPGMCVTAWAECDITKTAKAY